MAEKDRLRREQFKMWLLPEEKLVLEKNAFEKGISKADYVRQLIADRSVIGRQWTMDKEQGKQLLYELRKIGTNLNQIAYNTNAQKYASHKEWKAVKDNYFEMLDMIGKLPFLDEGAREEWQQQLSMLLRKQSENQ